LTMGSDYRLRVNSGVEDTAPTVGRLPKLTIDFSSKRLSNLADFT